MDLNQIAFWVGAFIGAFLISRFFLLLFKYLGDSWAKLGAAYGLSVIVIGCLGYVGVADGGAGGAMLTYAGPLLAWLIVDALAMKGRSASSSKA